jgi:hypothetical protein
MDLLKLQIDQFRKNTELFKTRLKNSAYAHHVDAFEKFVTGVEPILQYIEICRVTKKFSKQDPKLQHSLAALKAQTDWIIGLNLQLWPDEEELVSQRPADKQLIADDRHSLQNNIFIVNNPLMNLQRLVTQEMENTTERGL